MKETENVTKFGGTKLGVHPNGAAKIQSFQPLTLGTCNIPGRQI